MGLLVRQRKGKTGWWVIATHKKKRIYKRFNDPIAAKQFAHDLERALAAGSLHLTPTSPTLADYFERWLETSVRPYRKPSTLVSYRLGWNRYTARTRPPASSRNHTQPRPRLGCANDKKGTIPQHGPGDAGAALSYVYLRNRRWTCHAKPSAPSRFAPLWASAK